MCGITGLIAQNKSANHFLNNLNASLDKLKFRGPDNRGLFFYENIAFGHTRLKIIDTSDKANQPMQDISRRYVIIFNGEIYNYRELKKDLTEFDFITNSDTEVLLYLYIKYGKYCLEKLNGFFSFAIFDKKIGSVFLARDRFGIKPLYYYQDDEKFLFASELKALMTYDIIKKIDKSSLWQYLQFNYIPAPHSIFVDIKKLLPGHWLLIKDGNLKMGKYYELPMAKRKDVPHSFDKAKLQLEILLDESVKKRLNADVPLGTFLSGGIDSSIITMLASRYTENLNTFSIGFSQNPIYDETKYADLIASRLKTNHKVFSLTNDDFYDNLYHMLEYIDEPFADSSALPVYILSKNTKEFVTVALSGDGADEIFSGYNKHVAEYKIRNDFIANRLIKLVRPLSRIIPKSRDSLLGNLGRKFEKFIDGSNLEVDERYWFWASFQNQNNARALFKYQFQDSEYKRRKKHLLRNISKDDFNSILYADQEMVLTNDMLTKVDYMSMGNSLEVRVPFLDHNVVSYVNMLPSDYKINNRTQKLILKETFRKFLPAEIFNRPKHGFEIPLLQWFKGDLKSLIEEMLLSQAFIEEQNLFVYDEIVNIVKRLYSRSPGESASHVWNLIVFQHWYKRFMQ